MRKILYLLLLLLVLLVYAGCSQISLFGLVESEQEGEFSLGVDSVSLKVGSHFNFSSVGGYLPYTYSLKEGMNTGAIDPVTGVYTTPGLESEATVEGHDGIGHQDNAQVFIYEAIEAVPAAFSLRIDDPDHPDQAISLFGGAGPLTAMANLGMISPSEPVPSGEPGESVTYYYPPEDPGTDYIDVVDEFGNSLVIMVEVLPAVGDVDLEILPTYTVLHPEETVDFTVINNTANSLLIELSEDFGTLNTDTVAAGETVTREYTAPNVEGAVFLTVTEDIPSGDGLSVQADIYVQAEVTPLEITPGNMVVSPGTTVEFTASGGVPPYIFSRLNGSGTLVHTSPTTSNYTPESVIAMIRVTDGVDNQAKVKIQVQ